MEEVICYLLPASICTFIVSKQVKKIKNQDLVLIYLISTILIYLIEDVTFCILRGKEATKFFSVTFSIKYILFAIIISSILGVLFSFLYNRFSLQLEVKNEKDKKDKKSKKNNK